MIQFIEEHLSIGAHWLSGVTFQKDTKALQQPMQCSPHITCFPLTFPLEAASLSYSIVSTVSNMVARILLLEERRK